ncbi:MAG: hypothetical protein ABSD44_08805 [Terracidiphilus sp.]
MFMQLCHSCVGNATSPRQPLCLSQFESHQASYAMRLALGLALLLVFGLPGRAQQHPDPSMSPPFQQLAHQDEERSLAQMPDSDIIEKERQLRALNDQRQKSMVSDAAKLLKLAHELDDEISRTNPESLTEDELHKVAKIEKLARSVKEKMSTSVIGPAVNPQYPSPENRLIP